MALETQHAVTFGPGQRLVGVLDHRPGDAPVACLLLNVGVTHHMGPRRLNVKLARALAARGISSLRLDLSGLGDSGAPEAGERYRSQAVADLQAAMDHVQQATGIGRFAVLGICSGAVNAYRVAQADERVVGVMMFDGYAYPTALTRLVHDWRRATTLRPGAVAAKVWQRVRRLCGLPVADRQVSIFYASRDSSAPDRTQFAATLTALDARGVQVLIMYSDALLAIYNHASQFRRVFAGHDFVQRVQCLYLPHVDHIPTSQEAQSEFIGRVVDWVSATCIRSAAPAVAAIATA